MSRADEFIFLRIILKILGAELAFANELRFAVMMGILVEGVVLVNFPRKNGQ
jgi:hypothetical protein